MTDKLKDQASSLPPAEDGGKKIAIGKAVKGKQVIINPPEKVDTNQGGIRERFQQALQKHTVILEKKTEIVLQSKAARADLPEDVIKQVFVRGYKNLPLNTELTREQYAMNRVNSFIAGGAALQEDYDLIPIMERLGMKGTGGAMRPHIKAERNVYNGRMVYHVVNAKGQVKHTATDKWAAKKHLAQKYHSYMNEEVEQIDELSKSTLGSYAKKATRDARLKHGMGKDFERISKSLRKPEYKAGAKEWEDKYKSDARKREAGVNKAIDRLAKEEVEQVDYILEYESDLAKMKKSDSYKVGDKVWTKVGGQWHRGHITTPLNKAGNHGVKFHHKGMTHSTVSNPHSELRLNVEEVELDEVSTDGYYKAAIKDRMKQVVKFMGGDKSAKTKIDARNAGMKRVEKRTRDEMAKANSGPQKPVHREPSSMSSPQAYYASKKPGEYTGDSYEPQGHMVEAQSAAVRWQKALEAAKKKREAEEARNAENVKRALTPRDQK